MYSSIIYIVHYIPSSATMPRSSRSSRLCFEFFQSEFAMYRAVADSGCSIRKRNLLTPVKSPTNACKETCVRSRRCSVCTALSLRGGPSSPSTAGVCSKSLWPRPRPPGVCNACNTSLLQAGVSHAPLGPENVFSRAAENVFSRDLACESALRMRP